MANRLHQVGLPQADTAANEQRIELSSRRLGHGQGRRVGQATVLTDNETIEHIAGVQSGGQFAGAFTAAAGCLSWLRRGQGLGLRGPCRPCAGLLAAGRHHQHLHGLASHLAGDRLNGAQVVLAQPTAGEAAGGLQLQLALLVAAAAGWTDPGFKGGLAQAGL